MKRISAIILLLLCLALLLIGCRKKVNHEQEVASESDLAEGQVQTDALGNPFEIDEQGNTVIIDQQGNRVVVDQEGKPVGINEKNAAAENTAQTATIQALTTTATATTTAKKSNTCTISISVKAIQNNMNLLPQNKHKLVPSNGMLLGTTTMEFTPGESAYDILVKITRQKGIHLDSTYTAMYGSAYIKGIGNLYEFDCGGNSGWLYSVNGTTFSYGSSKYQVKAGDSIQFFYKCG